MEWRVWHQLPPFPVLLVGSLFPSDTTMPNKWRVLQVAALVAKDEVRDMHGRGIADKTGLYVQVIATRSNQFLRR